MRTAAVWLGLAIMLTVIVLAFIAYFVTSAGPVDGFGRPVSEAPWFIKFTGLDNWPGGSWYFVDMVLFWVGMATGGSLLGWGAKRVKLPEES